jgi:hypothetical protein
MGDEKRVREGAERWPRAEGLGFADGAKRWDSQPVSASTVCLFAWTVVVRKREGSPGFARWWFIRAAGSALVGISLVVVTFQEHSAGSFRRMVHGGFAATGDEKRVEKERNGGVGARVWALRTVQNAGTANPFPPRPFVCLLGRWWCGNGKAVPVLRGSRRSGTVASRIG